MDCLHLYFGKSLKKLVGEAKILLSYYYNRCLSPQFFLEITYTETDNQVIKTT